MTPKEQAIKKAYGEHYDAYREHMDPDGWVNVHDADPPEALPRDKRYDMGAYWRPKSLKGIERNNGWISVEEGLPGYSDLLYWVFTSLGGVFKAFWDGRVTQWHDQWHDLDGEVIPNVTHWQPVTKPGAPIY